MRWTDREGNAEFLDYIEDQWPHLAACEWSDPELQDHLKSFEARHKKQGRTASGRKAAATRAANAKAGISQVNLTGTVKQKKWASELRDSAMKTPGLVADGVVYGKLFNEKTSASFWIGHRNADFRKLLERLQTLFDEYQTAHDGYWSAKAQFGEQSPEAKAALKRHDEVQSAYVKIMNP